MSEKFVQNGPELESPISELSVGLQIYNNLVNNENKRPAFIDGITGNEVTYGQLFAITCRLAESLKASGYKSGDILGICSENNVQFFQPVLAGLYLGMTIAPFNQSYIGNELLHAYNITKAKIVFCSRATKSKFLIIKDQCSSLETIVVIDDPTDANSLENLMNKHVDKYFDEYTFKPTPVDTYTTAAVLCSSGTTGLPKGVMLSQKNISGVINQLVDSRINRFEVDKTKLGFLPFYHGYGFNTTIVSLICNHLVVVLPGFTETSFLNALQKYKISELMLVPPIATLLAKSPNVLKYDLTSIKEIVSAAAPLSKEIEEGLLKRLPGIFLRQGYGMTETSLGVLTIRVNYAKLGSVGQVNPGMKIKVKDIDSEESLGPDSIGEICVKGDMIMKGYYNNPEATKATINPDGWLMSGDLGYYDNEGYFYITGRIKELIKYKGFQVAPAELEALLLGHEKISDAAVIGLPDNLAGELPTAFIVKQAGVNLTEDEVKKYVANNLSNPKHLRGGVHFIGTIPKSPAGKIIRKELVEMAKSLHSKL